MSLEKYILEFKDVRPNRSGGNASPHKVCLLYAVMDLIEEGRIGLNAIYFNDELKRRFSWHFERLKGPKDSSNPALPFYYLKSSSFWNHQVSRESYDTYMSINTPSERTIKETISYAFLDEALFWLIKEPASSMKLRLALSENLDSREEGFRRWACSIGKSEKTVSNYVGALKNSISNWLTDAGIIDTNILSISDYFELTRLLEKANEVKEFAEYNHRGKGMYFAALKLYRSFLDELTEASLQNDIGIIQNDENLQVTEKTILMQARRGQGKFRERLIDHWKTCAVTKYGNISLLLASHIKPWAASSNGERLDPFNGLLLVPNLDKAFDLNYVSFNERGKILISEQLGDYETLGIRKEMFIELLPQHQDYMSYHRDKFFQKAN